MKIDRDNFRHLTGFGRDMANHVGEVLGVVDVIVPGNHIVSHDRNRNTFSNYFVPFEDNPGIDWWFANDRFHHKRLHQADYDGFEQTTLSIIAHDEKSRDITSIPLPMLFQTSQYHIYQHLFLEDQDGCCIENGCYTGVTKCGWRARWKQHLSAAKSGSHYRFHKAIREHHGRARIAMHVIVACTSSEQKAFEIEEYFVERDSLYPRGLNMIPGGKSGLAYLRKIGAIGKNERVGVDDRQQIINRFFENASRKGLPNPLAAANWLNADYAEKVICTGPDRLKPQQIRDARYLSALGQDVDTIMSRVGARNTAQVERLLSGQTYSRVQ